MGKDYKDLARGVNEAAATLRRAVPDVMAAFGGLGAAARQDGALDHKTKELITSGPYAYTQNPLYLGRILMVTGFFIAIELPYHLEWVLLALAWTVFLGYYMPRKTRVEGRRLRSFHGAPWEEYNRSVPVLFPSLRPYSKSVGKSFSARVMLGRNREYGMYLGLAITLAILAYKAFD